MSGVSRLRQAQKNHRMPIENVKQRKGRYTGATRAADPMDPRAPKKPDTAVFASFPTTQPPTGNESPSRGEGPERNVRRK